MFVVIPVSPGGAEARQGADREVLGMLENLGLVEQYEEVFNKQELSLEDIADMNHEELKSIGITSLKHRKAIINYVSGITLL